MPIQSKYLFIASMDVDPEHESLFNEVYDQEHVPILSKVPGVLSVARLKRKEQFARIGADELDRFFVGAREEASCKEVMEAMVNRVVNKLMHCVIKNIDMVAEEEGPAEAARILDTIVRQAEQISAESEAEKKDVQP